MPLFEYTASDRSGALTKGELEASDKGAASRALSTRGLFVLEIRPSTSPTPAPLPVATSERPPRVRAESRKERESTEAAPSSRAPFRRVRWSALDQALFLRQLNVMFTAGIPIHRAASVAGESENYHPSVRALLTEVPRALARGRTLSKSLEKSGLFGRALISTVKMGEESGRLDKVLKDLADAEEESVRLRRTLISRLTYPTVVLISMSLGLVIMGHVMGQVMSSLPNFKPQDIPLFGSIHAAFTAKAFLPVVFLLLLSLVVASRAALRNPSVRKALEGKFMSLPLFGSLLRRLEANTITRQLSFLLSAGLPIDRGMALCAETVLTESFRAALLQAQKDLRSGAELADCFRMSELFPEDGTALVTAGELSGKLESSLRRAAHYCSDQVERSLETLLALLEPLMIAFLGVTIGIVLLCTFVPVFNSLQTV